MQPQISYSSKKEELSLDEPSWLNTSIDENGLVLNNYFIENQDMILGEMVIDERKKRNVWRRQQSHNMYKH